MSVRAGERDLPGPEGSVGLRDLGFRLFAGEPAELRATDADARQDPSLVLLAVRVEPPDADTDRQEKAHDGRDAEAEGKRPTALGRFPRLVLGDGEHRNGLDGGLGGLGGLERVRRSVIDRFAWLSSDERGELGIRF
jgi:hypothetical protein